MAKKQNPFEARLARMEALTPDDGEGLWSELSVEGERLPVLTREFWTARQRQASNLHEVSYRACYKPQLPRYFIQRLTDPGAWVYDPFGGRGTTALEAALLGRRVASCDINPLSRILLEPRLDPPELTAVAARLAEIPRQSEPTDDLDLSMFYHADTEAELRGLRAWILEREAEGRLDAIDRWIRMVATNRLTGHSPGFFSVYTLPPNQATSPDRQRLINTKRNQVPDYRDTHALILRKSRQLLKELTREERVNLAEAAQTARFLTEDARRTPQLEPDSIALTVTSPPFLDVVNYAGDNWLRGWFNGIDAEKIAQSISTPRNVEDWAAIMENVFRELFRVTQPGGHVAFEVGEVHKGKLRLEEVVLPLGMRVGFQPLGVLVNEQTFTKTAHIWGVDNNESGTNSNRIALFEK